MLAAWVRRLLLLAQSIEDIGLPKRSAHGRMIDGAKRAVEPSTGLDSTSPKLRETAVLLLFAANDQSVGASSGINVGRARKAFELRGLQLLLCYFYRIVTW
jgi:hypothetical protein